jgi:hypothetical protein
MNPRESNSETSVFESWAATNVPHIAPVMARPLRSMT